MTIVEFLAARLEEEEQAAKAAADASGYDTWLSIGIEAGPDDDAKWTAIADRSWGIVAPHPDPPDDDTFYELGGELFRQRGSRGLTDHIARHDPARVLREIAAKQAIVAAYLPSGEDPHPGLPCINYEGQDPETYSEWDTCSRHIKASERRIHHDYVIRLLAVVHSDHPDYDPAWAA
ncbi:DUF6221 family protein [Nocardiopsis sp. CA-288880]|uniref:DUF6221 family protein n=1 Tax=Nocardiopsis sp. CA-288880 TaxID=3239995 RepID=UPI003D99D04C